MWRNHNPFAHIRGNHNPLAHISRPYSEKTTAGGHGSGGIGLRGLGEGAWIALLSGNGMVPIWAETKRMRLRHNPALLMFHAPE